MLCNWTASTARDITANGFKARRLGKKFTCRFSYLSRASDNFLSFKLETCLDFCAASANSYSDVIAAKCLLNIYSYVFIGAFCENNSV